MEGVQDCVTGLSKNIKTWTKYKIQSQDLEGSQIWKRAPNMQFSCTNICWMDPEPSIYLARKNRV